MDTIRFPDGRTFSARFAADVPGSGRFAALLPGLSPAEAAALFAGVSSFTAENPLTGSRTYAGYTRLIDARPLQNGALAVLEKEE